MITLTDEQALAAAAPERLVNIVSAPGSGKTTVAAERFGYQRHQKGDLRGVLGLSFTRAAVSELTTRVSARWGSACITFPHRVMTFDALHTTLLEALLSAGLLRWPGGHTRLDVKDDYRGSPGYRWLTTSSYQRFASPNAHREIISAGRKVTKPGGAIGNKEQHDALLRAGTASHGDVRDVLAIALKDQELRKYAAEWLASNFRAVIIDEVYDAASLDLTIAFLATEAGLGVTVIGDPRQALYGWRGATPGLVGTLFTSTSDRFVEYEQSHSFRFLGDQMPDLASTLRKGEPASIPQISSHEVDVALARRWQHLWDAGDNVLPLAFRNISNATDAAINLLLDVVTRARLGRNAYGREAAITQLRLDRDRLVREQEATMRPLLVALIGGQTPGEALDAIRGAAVALGANRRPSRLQYDAEADRVEDVRRLALRLQQAKLIPGLTVHQAKGGEWPRVGVVLTKRESQLLASGLRPLDDDDCVVYVALTRAKFCCGQLAGNLTLDVEAGELP